MSSSNNSIDSVEFFFVQIGSTVLLDNLYLGLIVPLAIISFILNSVSYLVFSVPNQSLMRGKKELKFYLKIYCLFSIFMSLLALLNALISAPRYLSFSLTYWISFYKFEFSFFQILFSMLNKIFEKFRCKIQPGLLSAFFLFLNTIDCVLLLDRITSVSQMPTLRSVLKLNPFGLSLFIFLVSCLLQVPFYFFVSGRTSEEYAQAQKENYQYLVNFTYCLKEPFFTTVTARILAISSVLIRDVLIIFIETYLAIYSIKAFRKYLRDLRGSNSAHVFNRLELFNIGLSKMSFFLAFMSIMVHLFSLIQFFITAFDNINILARFFNVVAGFFLNLKYISNFFLFYYFNQSFHDFFRPNYQNHEIRLTHLGL
jgi:hypothetical protein